MSKRYSAHRDLRVPNELAREYLARYAGVTHVKTTTKSYDTNLTDFVGWLSENGLDVLSAEWEDIVRYVEDQVRRGYRKSTIESKTAAIAGLYRFVRLRTDAADDLSLDPLMFRTLDMSQYNTPPPIERIALSREEIRLLFDSFNSYRNRLMTVVCVETGIRNSDVRELRMKDVNSDHIHVHDPKNSRPYDVPISDDLAFELEYWLEHIRNGYAAAESSEYVFPSQCGEKLESNGSFSRIIRQAAERAEIQKVIGESEIKETDLTTTQSFLEWYRVTPHTLRHSFITLLKDSGVSLSYRMLVANHRDASTNLGYTHNGNDVIDVLRDRFDPPR